MARTQSWYQGGGTGSNKDFGAFSQMDLTQSLISSVAQARAQKT